MNKIRSLKINSTTLFIKTYEYSLLPHEYKYFFKVICRYD